MEITLKQTETTEYVYSMDVSRKELSDFVKNSKIYGNKSEEYSKEILSEPEESFNYNCGEFAEDFIINKIDKGLKPIRSYSTPISNDDFDLQLDSNDIPIMETYRHGLRENSESHNVGELYGIMITSSMTWNNFIIAGKNKSKIKNISSKIIKMFFDAIYSEDTDREFKLFSEYLKDNNLIFAEDDSYWDEPEIVYDEDTDEISSIYVPNSNIIKKGSYEIEIVNKITERF